MAKSIVGKIKSKNTWFGIAKDTVALVGTGVATAYLREIGALLGYFLVSEIAEHKEFARGISVLLLADSLAERFIGGKGIV